MTWTSVGWFNAWGLNMKTLDYLLLLRSAWLGGLLTCLYLVRPVLEHHGYFPHHGMEVMHWLAGAGLVMGFLMVTAGMSRRLFRTSQLGSRLILLMMLLSGVYFGFMPWWKLQMILLQVQAALAVLWIWVAPRQVL